MMAALTLQKEGKKCEKVKQHPVLFDKQFKGYREKDVVTNACNAVAKEIKIIENCETISIAKKIIELVYHSFQDFARCRDA